MLLRHAMRWRRFCIVLPKLIAIALLRPRSIYMACVWWWFEIRKNNYQLGWTVVALKVNKIFKLPLINSWNKHPHSAYWAAVVWSSYADTFDDHIQFNHSHNKETINGVYLYSAEERITSDSPAIILLNTWWKELDRPLDRWVHGDVIPQTPTWNVHWS